MFADTWTSTVLTENNGKDRESPHFLLQLQPLLSFLRMLYSRC